MAAREPLSSGVKSTRLFVQDPRGFSLLELLFTVSLLCILLTLAVPAYQQYVHRAHRAEAMLRIVQLADCQERWRARSGQFRVDSCAVQSNDRYRFEVEISDNALFYRISAHPTGMQLSDTCGALSLDSLGERGASGEGAAVTRCWAAR